MVIFSATGIESHANGPSVNVLSAT